MAEYICTDIHGAYDKFIKLLQAIDFNDGKKIQRPADHIYILGDCIDTSDKNGKSYELLIYILSLVFKDCCTLIKGNHGFYLQQYIQNELSSLSWDKYGGRDTRMKIDKLSFIEKHDLLDSISKLKHYCIIDTIWGPTILTHSGISADYILMNAKKDIIDIEGSIAYAVQEDEKAYLESMDLYNLPNSYYDKFSHYLIVGHVITDTLGNGEKNKILITEHYMNLDIGCGHGMDRKLACYCIDNNEVIYV